MKRLFLLAVCMLSMLAVSAQMRPALTFEVGIGMSGWMGDKPSGTNALFNPRVGISADIPLNEWFSFQPGLSWVSKGAKADIPLQIRKSMRCVRRNGRRRHFIPNTHL